MTFFFLFQCTLIAFRLFINLLYALCLGVSHEPFQFRPREVGTTDRGEIDVSLPNGE